MSANDSGKTKSKGMSAPVLGVIGLALVGFYIASALKPKVSPAVVIEPTNEYRGIAVPVNGDTVDLNGIRHRIWGIDAPDPGGDAGEYAGQSKAALETASQYQWICTDTGDRSRGRYVSKCRFALNDEDVGSWMVTAGYAVDWPAFSGGAYRNEQARAQNQGLGIWQTYTESWR